MISFRVTDIQGGLLTIERPAGQEISLKLAEIVRGQVMEILPSGAVALKIKGEPLIAKTQVPLQPGTNPYFKVTGIPVEGKDLTLQFIGFAPEEEPQVQQQQIVFSDARKDHLMGLIKELTTLLKQIKDYSNEPISKTGKLQSLTNEILRSLPQDIQKVPKEIRTQLQELLQTSLKITGQGIQTKITDLINLLPKDSNLTEEIANIKRDISVNIDKLSNISLKGAIQDTGVALEAKLRSVAVLQEKTLDLIPKEPQLKASSPSDQKTTTNLNTLQTTNLETSQTKDNRSSDVKMLIHNDLKAKLLQLKDAIFKGEIKETSTQQDSNKAITTTSVSKTTEQLAKTIDTILKDIETFQTLSKATNSFYTFLPVDWRGLKDGDIAFKKGKARGSGITPYSCRVNLNLDKVGQVGFIVLKFGADYYISFRTEDKGFQVELKEGIDELKTNFAQKGMRLNSVNFFDLDETDSYEELERIFSEDKGGVDLKA
ncbi:MAG: hypothetical protein N3A62_03670 [Thermodesulfovibrionales bacterium]|nr:hypothetical protein [Thermodesulfovibrionales bacterium]